MKPKFINPKQLRSTLPDFIIHLFGKPSRTGSIVITSIVLAVITLAIYLQVGNHQFLNFDDNIYVTNNPHVAGGLTDKNIIWAFSSVDASNWHPLTWLSHMSDVQFYGMNPRGHHLTSVVIHTFSTVLLFLLLVRLTGALWQSSFVAALFALHPLHVESVAWVAERKDVLSAFFWFLTLILYAEYVAKRKTSLYILVLFSFMLGLMSKPMLVTLPIVMLLLDFWPLDRYRNKDGQEPLLLPGRAISLVKEKIPFLACSLLSSFITIYAQENGGAISDLSVVPLWFRIENALISYFTYIGKTFWPHDLAVLYPLTQSITLWQAGSSLFILILLSAAAFRARRGHPYFAVGWFWFLITLVPVIGLIQVGSQSMADRYTYIPVIGLFIIVAWGVADLFKDLRHRQKFLALLAGTVIFASATISWKQISYWSDNITLYRHTLRVTANNYIIHNDLGFALAGAGQLNAAIQEYQKALLICPDHANAHYNLGTALHRKGFLNAAILEYRESLRITPNNTDAHINLGRIFAGQGHLDEAIQEFQQLLLITTDNKDAHYNLGLALSRKGSLDAAVQEYKETLRIDPNDTNAKFSLKLTLEQMRGQNSSWK